MNNLRFATVIHILVLAVKAKEEDNKIISSDYIAGSINVNAVVVRREIQVLKNAGILDSKKGKEGGCFLIKEPNEILFGDLYLLINQDNSFCKLNQPNPICPIGNQMNNELNRIFTLTENQIVNNLNKISLQEFTNQF